MTVAHTSRRGRHAPIVGATKARSGAGGLQVLWILVVSSGLAGIGLLALLAIQAPSLSGPGGQVSTQRPTISAPATPAKQSTGG